MTKHIRVSILIVVVGIALAYITYIHETNKSFEVKTVQQENTESIIGTYRCGKTETTDGKKYTFLCVFKKDHTFTDITIATDVSTGRQHKKIWPEGTYAIVEANSYYPYDRLCMKHGSGSITTADITIDREVFQIRDEYLWIKQN